MGLVKGVLAEVLDLWHQEISPREVVAPFFPQPATPLFLDSTHGCGPRDSCTSGHRLLQVFDQRGAPFFFLFISLRGRPRDSLLRTPAFRDTVSVFFHLSGTLPPSLPLTPLRRGLGLRERDFVDSLLDETRTQFFRS